MSALAWIDVVILQRHLNDDTSGTDMRPLHWHAEVMVAGAPTARTYQDVILAFGEELAIDALDVVSHIVIVHRREMIVVLHIHHVGDILADAMSQRVVGAQQTVGIRYRLHILIQHLLGIHDRSNL